MTDTPSHDVDDGEMTIKAGLRILVVDDNATNRQVAELMLAAIGAEVICAADGLEAVTASEHMPFDVILMDLQMPKMDGLTATRQIRRREQATGSARTPIVVLSANVMPEHISASFAAGADDHLGKPFHPDDLISAVASAHQGRGRSEPLARRQ
jgi:CheY-like chemotaxis protein